MNSKKKASFSKKEWIAAGFKALNKSGYLSIKVEAIARQLKISKGSFYWHFKNAAELKASMLESWVEQSTNSIIHVVEENSTKPTEQLRLLVKITSDLGANQRDNHPFDEAAIRHWARFEPQVAKTMKQVDQARLAFVEKLFLKILTCKKEAHLKANILYASLIGLEHLSYHNMANLENDLPKLLEMLIGSYKSTKNTEK